MLNDGFMMVWRCPEIGVPLNHPCFHGILKIKTKHFWGIPICGTSIWVQQCHKAPMTGNGKHTTTYRNGDDSGMVYGIVLPTLLLNSLLHHQFPYPPLIFYKHNQNTKADLSWWKREHARMPGFFSVVAWAVGRNSAIATVCVDWEFTHWNRQHYKHMG